MVLWSMFRKGFPFFDQVLLLGLLVILSLSVDVLATGSASNQGSQGGSLPVFSSKSEPLPPPSPPHPTHHPFVVVARRLSPLGASFFPPIDTAGSRTSNPRRWRPAPSLDPPFHPSLTAAEAEFGAADINFARIIGPSSPKDIDDADQIMETRSSRPQRNSHSPSIFSARRTLNTISHFADSDGSGRVSESRPAPDAQPTSFSSYARELIRGNPSKDPDALSVAAATLNLWVSDSRNALPPDSVTAEVEELSARIGLPVVIPRRYFPSFWATFKEVVHEPEAMFAVNHATELESFPQKYYSKADYSAFLSVSNLNPSAPDYVARRNEIAAQYRIKVANRPFLFYRNVFSSITQHLTMLYLLPTFSGVLFFRGMIEPRSSSTSACCIGGMPSNKADFTSFQNLKHGELHSLPSLGLTKNGILFGSRRPYAQWYSPLTHENEIRVILLSKNCRYVQPFLRKKLSDFDAVVVRPVNGTVRVLEMIQSGYRTLILSEF